MFFLMFDRKPVAGAAHGLHQIFFSHRFKNLAQSADMHIDSAILDKNMIAPDTIEQLRASVHTFLIRHQKMQQTEFRRAKRNLHRF